MNNNNNNGKVGVLYSWPVIILALFIFWPIAVFLIIKRVTTDRRTAMGAGKLIGGLGVLLYVCAAFCLLPTIFNGGDSDLFLGGAVMVAFCGAAGFALKKVSKNIVKNANDVKQYLAVIVNGNMRQLDSIASAVGKPYDVVRKDIGRMIDQGYLKNAYINEGMRELVLPVNTPAVPNMAYANPNPNVKAAPVQTRVVACPCCGANNTIVGKLGECEYCGSPLS